MTKAEEWFGKKKKDLNEEETKEYFKLVQRERRKRPDVQEYIKKNRREYVIKNREKVNQAKREWNRKNPDKIKKYRNTGFKREIAVLEKALELACDYLLSNEGDELYELVKDIYDDSEYLKTKINYFKTKAKEVLKNE